MRLIVGISGATGVCLGFELIKALKKNKDCEIHLIVTEGAKETLRYEGLGQLESLTQLADYCHDDANLAAVISSGSYRTDGMIVIPCSMKSLSGIAHGYASNLLVRAADVCLKENRKVVLVPREMPLGKVHLQNLLIASELGCAIIPPMLTFYNKPQTLEDQVHHIIGKILMQFDLHHEEFRPWEGI